MSAPQTTSAQGGSDVDLLCAIVVRGAMRELIAAFERQSTYKVFARFELNPVIKTQIAAGCAFDFVVVNAAFVGELADLQKVRRGTSYPFGRIPMGVAVQHGAPKPDLSSVEAFKHTLLAARSIAYEGEGSSGAYFIDLLDRLDLRGALKAKLKSVDGGMTGHIVARGEAELGVVPVSTILAAAPGAVVAGAFPRELDGAIDVAMGISRAAREVDACYAFSEFLRSADVEPLMKAHGIDRLA